LEEHEHLLTPSPSVCWNVELVGSLLADLGARNVLVVVDKRALLAAGLGREVFRQTAGCVHEEFSDFEPNPSWQSGAAAARLAGEIDADAVVAIGGGSCCDVAKVAALGCRNPRMVDALARGEGITEARPVPIIAVPTTSGTGSEATHFAAIYVEGRKVSVTHPSLLPTVAVLDDRFHLAMPAQLAAASGMDALAQAMESMWAVGATAESLRLAEAGGRLVAANIEASVCGGDPDARRAMMLGSHLAGRAINISKTTAAHALSYQLTMRYGLAHGHAVALTVGHLASAIEHATADDCVPPLNLSEIRVRVRRAAGLLGVGPQDLPRRIASLLDSLGLACDLRTAGVEREALPQLAADVDPVRLNNNPRRMSTAELTGMLEAAWGPPVITRTQHSYASDVASV
jgi:alcohol dehydrogenase class IV